MTGLKSTCLVCHWDDTGVVSHSVELLNRRELVSNIGTVGTKHKVGSALGPPISL